MSYKKKKRKKESYNSRRKKAYDKLREYNISIGLAKRTIYRYPLNLIEKLIKKTEKREPDDPDNYFLDGLKRSMIKYGDNRKRNRKNKFLPVEEAEKKFLP